MRKGDLVAAITARQSGAPAAGDVRMGRSTATPSATNGRTREPTAAR